MQGNERNNGMIDPQFTDQAWSEMSNLLDKEMPVANKPVSDNKKRYGLLLLFLFIGFASGVGTMFLLQNETTPDTTPVESTINPRKVAAIVNGTKELRTLTTMAGETKQLASTNQVNKNIEQKIKTSFSNNSNRTIDDKKLYKNSSSVIVNNPLVNNSSLSNERTDLGINTLAPVNNTSKAERTVQSVSTLNSSEIELLDLPKSDEQFDLITPVAEPKVSLGLYGSTLTRDFSGMHGWSAGFRASYALDSRFSIRTGLGYSVISGFQLESLGITEPLTPAYFEPIEADLQNYSTVSSLENNQDLPIQNLQYIDLPVGLNYKMSNKISILMGMKFSYLVNATTDGYVLESLDREEERLLDQAMYGSMRKMDVGTVLGFGFYPTKSIGVELKYNHGFVDYTIDEKWHIRQLNTNKNFELGLNYLFK